jgi:hypothetical protein
MTLIRSALGAYVYFVETGGRIKVSLVLIGESDPGFLHLLVGKEPDERFVVQVNNLDTIAEWVMEIATKARDQRKAVLFRQLLPHLVELRFIAHDETEMSGSVRLWFFNPENGEELVLADFEKCIAFAFIHLLELEDVFVKGDRFGYVVHLDREMINSINSHAHSASNLTGSRRLSHQLGGHRAVGASGSVSTKRRPYPFEEATARFPPGWTR